MYIYILYIDSYQFYLHFDLQTFHSEHTYTVIIARQQATSTGPITYLRTYIDIQTLRSVSISVFRRFIRQSTRPLQPQPKSRQSNMHITFLSVYVFDPSDVLFVEALYPRCNRSLNRGDQTLYIQISMSTCISVIEYFIRSSLYVQRIEGNLSFKLCTAQNSLAWLSSGSLISMFLARSV